jgi:prevent-host-death family protein
MSTTYMNITEARKVLTKLDLKSGDTIVITRYGKPVAAIISIKDYEKFQEYERSVKTTKRSNKKS